MKKSNKIRVDKLRKFVLLYKVRPYHEKMEKKSMGNNEELTITLKCLFGFEQTLVEELEELGYPKAEQLNRAVRIKGTLFPLGFYTSN